MTQTELPDLTQALLDAARKAGAESADALAVDGLSLSVDVRQGKLEQAERSEGTEIGLRVLIGQRQACVSASDTRPETIRDMAERAVIMARLAPEDRWIGLAESNALSPTRDAEGLELCDPAPDPAAATLEDLARRAEAAALAKDGISMVDSASAGFGRQRIHLAASNGFSGGYARSSHSISCVAITGSGTTMERDWAHESRVYGADMPDPESIGTRAAERTLARAGARQARTGAFPVVFDERISSSLIGHLLSAANGAAVARGATWLRDALGEAVLPEGLSVIEDPHRVRIGGSRPFDAEGLPTRQRAIVDKGVLTGWTLDLASARKLGMQSTGSAQRGPSAPPSPGVSNIALTQGTTDRAGLLAQIGTGFLVTSMIGSSINPTTGDYSRGASGFWVENGEITYPVSGVTIAGNLRQMLKTLIPANDAKTFLGHVVPSLIVEGLTLAGA
ncbi:TldD/PmbA family protein [Frigidibacter sp. ROC022]|uniref:TldD/PmbA family protein n=1 Tax=Frigidibacter sp. ROC022 TaxID=2971796 RepID=UPI00215A47F6|nr:TldD/PmbA family protein [Frigidibacter sp. ROC022]MCR8724939.1 TldD/PmbA family protein [Frigidibacter sp. ROC022]